MTLEYVLKKEHVVIEDDVHAILDLTKTGEIECYATPEYDLVAWNKEESCVFGLLNKTGETYKLSFNVANHGEYDLELDKVLEVCNERFEAMLDWRWGDEKGSTLQFSYIRINHQRSIIRQSWRVVFWKR